MSAALPDDRAVSDFWAEVAARGTPLLEPDGDAVIVTFLWRDPDAAAVILHVNRLTDFRCLDQSMMRRLPGTDVWHLSYRMPPTWRASYGVGPLSVPLVPIDPDRLADKARWRRLRSSALPDPLNRASLRHRADGPALSVVALAGAPPQRWFAARPGVARGRVGRHQVGDRTVWSYLPPGAGHRDLPVVVLLDGDVWGGQGLLGATLDNLIAAGRIPPTVVLMVDCAAVPTRSRDLTCNPAFAGFLAGDLLAWAAARWPVTSDPAATVVAGQSLGGLAAAYTALCAPDRFGAVLSQSGSYWFPGGDVREWLTGRYAATERLPLRWYLEVGTREWDLVEPTRRLRDVLLGRGYPVTYAEFDGGHDVACWRGGLGDGLIAVLGNIRQS
ncbi:enterochelin esterase [Solwaraspora sp. WMMB762]|uniref:enterochelin esterase n=1 Tax=Solwaraspora sp. WMMB762 TaxID=3404120 RepID=UPI003B926AC6